MILAIEDEKDVRRLIRRSLEALGYKVMEAADATEGRRLLVQSSPELVLLDLGLPDEDGQSFIRSIREWSDIPIIVLSARDRELEKVEALENGADDYLTKPFSPLELSARIKVALRHAAKLGGDVSNITKINGLVHDAAGRRVLLDNVPVHLTPIEYKLFTALIRHPGKVLTHSQIIRHVWGKHTPDSTQVLRIHMQHLREKLGDSPLAPRFIFTEPGIGYRFRDQ